MSYKCYTKMGYCITSENVNVGNNNGEFSYFVSTYCRKSCILILTPAVYYRNYLCIWADWHW
jgi:hypothetical protein